MSYTSTLALPPRSLTEGEQRALLKVTGDHARGFRDHVIISVGLGTALRQHEILGLDVGDVLGPDGKARRRVRLRIFKRSNNDPTTQEVVLPDNLRAKLEKFWAWKKRRGESVEPTAPLFISRRGNRLSARQLRHLFHQWQERAGFERRLPFHSLRHSCLMTIYSRSRDIRMTQKIARHRSISSTLRYAGPSDGAVQNLVKDLPC